MNDNNDPLAKVKAATEEYRLARRSLDFHRGLARHGMANNLAFAVAAEHSAFHRLLRVSAEFEKSQPTPAPRPVTTAAPAATIKQTPAKATAPTASKTALPGSLDDRLAQGQARLNASLGLPPSFNPKG